MPRAGQGSPVGMAMGAGEEPHGKPAAAVSPAEAAQGRVLPARAPHGTDRVRRPADLMLAVFSLLIVAVVLGFIRALPLGSTEVAGDVSGWLLHIPRWLSFAAAVVAAVACFVLVDRGACRAGAQSVAGRAERGRRRAGRCRGGRHRGGRLAGRARGDGALGAARQQSLDVRGGHRVHRVRGGNRPGPAFALVALVAALGRGAAAQRAGRRHAHALRGGDRAVRRADGGLGAALAARRGLGPAGHRRSS